MGDVRSNFAPRERGRGLRGRQHPAHGTDTRLQEAVIEEAVRGFEERSQRLEADRRNVFRELERLTSAIRDAVARDDSTALRLLREKSGAAEERLNCIIDQRRSLEAERINEADVREAMTHFDPCWNQMVPRERTRLLELIIEKVLVDTEAGKMAVQFRPAGIQSLLKGGAR